MEKRKIQMLVWIVVGLVVLVLLYFLLGGNQLLLLGSKEFSDQMAIESDSVETAEKKDTTTNKPTVFTPSLSYDAAVAQYKDRRIQLDPNCQAVPNTVTYKDNTGIMIDNRSSKARTVKVGTTFVIAPYGFKIVVLPDVYLKSRTVLVDCDQSQNVATVLIQE